MLANGMGITEGTSGTTGCLVSFDDILKARPQEDGGKRYIFCEPSVPNFDTQNQRILSEALMWSKDLFLTKGNLDLWHRTVPVIAKALGLENPDEWEIGRPLEVRPNEHGIPLMKGEIYRPQSEGAAERANWFWQTLTAQDPPQRWFPSIYAKPVEGGMRRVFDPASGTTREVITKALWLGVGFAKVPINLGVEELKVQPFGEFAKAALFAESAPVCTGEGCECGCAIAKAISANTGTPAGGTDMAALTGGAALRTQSHDGLHDLHEHRAKAARFLKSLGTDTCPHSKGGDVKTSMRKHFEECEGLSGEEASDLVERTLRAYHARSRGRLAA